jgi:hypothetical protein
MGWQCPERNKNKKREDTLSQSPGNGIMDDAEQVDHSTDQWTIPPKLPAQITP